AQRWLAYQREANPPTLASAGSERLIKKQKPRRLGSPIGCIDRRKFECMNNVRTNDSIFDQTKSGSLLNALVIIDEHIRECLALEVGEG
ncbi:hypothetical protein N9M41_06785, partial [Rhodopirellula sp.]|nr:hypothetical protein [Rhodopirellula sp.]